MEKEKNKTTTKNNSKAKVPLIFSKIPAIMADISAISKDRENVQQKYSFRGIDDVYNEVHAAFVKHKVFTVPKVIDAIHEERKSRSGGTLIYRILTIKYTFFAEDGSFIETVVIGEGMDSGDKAGNKALSVAHKYALLQILLIPTDDPKDPENETPEVNGEPEKKKKKKEKKESDNPLDDAVYNGEEEEAKEAEKKSYANITVVHTDGKTYQIDKFKALELFGQLKKAIGNAAYYGILGEAGYEKSNEVPPKKIPEVYAKMVEAFKG